MAWSLRDGPALGRLLRIRSCVHFSLLINDYNIKKLKLLSEMQKTFRRQFSHFILIPVLLLDLSHNVSHFIRRLELRSEAECRFCLLKFPLGLLVIEVDGALEGGRPLYEIRLPIFLPCA